jgi:hypothetical protein
VGFVVNKTALWQVFSGNHSADCSSVIRGWYKTGRFAKSLLPHSAIVKTLVAIGLCPEPITPLIKNPSTNRSPKQSLRIRFSE